jgi:hypothetical protein
VRSLSLTDILEKKVELKRRESLVLVHRQFALIQDDELV